MQSRNVDNTPPKQAWFGSLFRGAVIALAAAAVFSWFGVYDTGNSPFLERMILWSATISAGIAVSAFVMPRVFEGKLKPLHWSIRVLIAAAIISVPVTLVLMLVELWLGDLGPMNQLFGQYAYVLAVSVVLTGLAYGYAELREGTQTAPLPAASGASGPPPFIDRLPVRLRAAEIWAVSAEDHYLRVHTSAGEELILLRLADAIRELGGLDGLQTHRSWWVARAGLADVQKGDGKLVLKLKSGAEAPVSRTYLKAVRDAGWS